MESKRSAQSRGPVLVCTAKTEHMPILTGILSGQEAYAEICRDVAELCGKISNRVEAAIISGDLLTKEATPLITRALGAQPEWSDLPVIIAAAGGADAPVAAEAMSKLGHVLLLDDPFTPAALKNVLQIALRSRERQRWARDLTKECERAMQVAQEFRDHLEQKVQARTSELAEKTSQLSRLTGELIVSEQRERRRLARILHDHLQQLLVSAKYRVASLNRVDNPAVKEAAEEIEGLLGEVIEASRSLTSELSPPIVHEGGLRTGMEWLVSFMAAQNGLNTRLKIDSDIDQIDENTKVLLFESTRELLLNIVKHAQVRSADVSVREIEEDQVEVVVTDQGVGFNAAFPKHGGFGLFRIRERLKLIGGHFEIQSAPGKGSRFAIVAPLRRPAAAAASAGPIHQTKATIPRSETPVTGTIRILIADDHAVMRQGLSTSLGEEPDIAIVGEAADGEMALEKTRSLRPDVVLMDLGMPRMGGVEATQRIHSEMPKVRVIGLSMFEEKESAKAMLDAGAVAYLSKGCSVEALTTAIRRCVGKPGLR